MNDAIHGSIVNQSDATWSYFPTRIRDAPNTIPFPEESGAAKSRRDLGCRSARAGKEGLLHDFQ
jgi:hypothetical protein